jgi:microsomal dipeptidase-like Zn-dependent dipeptidase
MATCGDAAVTAVKLLKQDPRFAAAGLALGRLSAVLGVEGAQALEERPERVRELRRRGVSFMSLTHLANNAWRRFLAEALG